MKKIITMFLVSVVALSLVSCQSTKESEEAKAERLAKREAHANRKKRAQVTTLPGLNDVEMNALQSAESESKQTKNSNYIYARNPKEVERPYLNELNDEDQNRIQKFKESNSESEKASSEWIYGF